MKKYTLIILVLVLISTVSAASFVRDGRNYNVNEFRIEKGWNLVYWFDLGTITSNTEMDLLDIKVIYVFDPFEQDYVMYYPENKLFDYTERSNVRYSIDEWEYKWPYFGNMAVWLYSSSAGTVSYRRSDILELENTKLKAGWNFVGIIPDMTCTREDPFEIKDFAGNCNLEETCGWALDYDGETMRWYCDLQTEEMYAETSEGRGLVIKVAEDCTLGFGSDSPPQLPE